MKLARFATVTMLTIIVAIGLLSTAFLPKISAALFTSGRPTNVTLVATMPGKQPGIATPTATKALPMNVVLAQDTFQRADHIFWGTASDGHIWGADANSQPGFATMNHAGRI